MTRTRTLFALSLLALSLLALSPATAAAKDAPAGIVRLSERITEALDRIETKLRQDKQAWREAMEFYFGAVESELAQARLKRREFRHAELALRLRTSWTKEPFRTAVPHASRRDRSGGRRSLRSPVAPAPGDRRSTPGRARPAGSRWSAGYGPGRWN